MLREVQDSSAGHLFSYAKWSYNVTYSFLFEVYGGYANNKKISGSNIKCFKIFNPNTLRFKNYLIEKWSNALDYTMRSVLKALK